MSIRRQLRPVAAAAALALAVAQTATAGSVVGMKSEMENAPPTADAMFLRPLAIPALLMGAVLFVPVGTMTFLLRKDVDKPFDALVRRPYEYVFVDPLGEH